MSIVLAVVISLKLVNISHAPLPVIAEAERVAADIYAAIGVDLRWSDTPSSLLVILRDDEPGDLRRATQSVLGAAIHTPNGSPVAYVFYRRIAEQAERYLSAPASILGSAIAHEVGHLLLPTRDHGHVGLMRGYWEYPEFQRAANNQLRFSRDEGESIRANIPDQSRMIDREQ
jgi:hypothetical protein